LGISGGGDDSIVRLTRHITSLLADKFFPTDIRVDTILEWLITPKVASRPKNISSVLIAMGASPGTAITVAANIQPILDSYIKTTVPLVYSTQDQIIGLLDTSLSSLNRVVETSDYFLQNNAFSSSIRTMAFISSMIAPLHYDNGDVRPRKTIKLMSYALKNSKLEKAYLSSNQPALVDAVGYYSRDPMLYT
jgi:hypothetical protein